MRTCILILLLAFSTTAQARAHKKKKSLLDAAAAAVASSLVPAPVDKETCFSPDGPCDVKLAKFMASAEHSLDVAIYDVNREQVVHQLLVASKKIPVRVLVDRKQAQGAHSAVALLVEGGVQVRYGHQRGIMHNKFTIVDGKRIETGSFNYTTHAAEANNENQVYLADEQIVNRYVKRFNEIWNVGDPVSERRGIAGKH